MAWLRRESVSRKAAPLAGTPEKQPAPARPAGVAALLLHLQATGGNQMALRMLGPSGAGPEAAGDELAARISTAQQRGGEPLAGPVRAEARQPFPGLGDVRVHRDAEAGSLAGELGALAFTTGQDVFFSPGRYEPGSAAGFALLSHELAHTVQQQGGAVPSRSVSPKLLVSTPGDRDEQAADAAAADASARRATNAVGAGDAGSGS